MPHCFVHGMRAAKLHPLHLEAKRGMERSHLNKKAMHLILELFEAGSETQQWGQPASLLAHTLPHTVAWDDLQCDHLLLVVPDLPSSRYTLLSNGDLFVMNLTKPVATPILRSQPQRTRSGGGSDAVTHRRLDYHRDHLSFVALS